MRSPDLSILSPGITDLFRLAFRSWDFSPVDRFFFIGNDFHSLSRRYLHVVPRFEDFRESGNFSSGIFWNHYLEFFRWTKSHG